MSFLRPFFTLSLISLIHAGDLTNPGFEKLADNKPTGWKLGNELTSLAADQGVEGSRCLRIVDALDSTGSDILSNRFSVSSDRLCVVRLSLFLESGDRQGLGVYLRMWNAAGNELVEPRERQISRPKMIPGEWSDAIAMYEIPDDVVEGAIWLHTFSSAITTCRVDNIRVSHLESQATQKAGDWVGGELVPLENGKAAVRWTHMKSPTLTQTFNPPADWSKMGMLRFRLHSFKATGASFMLILSSENPETEGSDYYSFRITQDWDGWRQFELPLAELGIAREPLGWDSIKAATFTATGWNNTPHPDGVIMLTDWEVSGERRFGPSMDDKAFFEALDLDLPALKAVKAAVDQGDYEKAKSAFADHIRNRTWPTWSIDWRDQPMHGVKVPKPEEDKDPESWDYYSKFITVDWKGWKKFTFKKEDFPTRTFVEGKGWRGKQPIGWHWIKYLAINATGWGLTPDPETVLHFDDIRLVGPEKTVLLTDFEGEDQPFSGLEQSMDVAKSGQHAGRWSDMPANAHVKCWDLPHDWTKFDQIEFWIHSREATGARIILVLDSDPPKASAKAEKLVNKEFSFGFSNRQWPIKFEDKIDWHANPTEGVNRTHLWNESLNRHFHFRDLSKAYWETGDDRYAATIAEHVMDWIKRNPRPLLSSGNRSAMTNCTWQTLTTGIRMEGIWPDTLYRCLGSPAFTDDVIATMVKSCADQADHLVANPTGGNWLTEESMGVYTVGMLFPEYRRAKEWRQTAIERLNRQLDEDVYPDGMEVELAAGYSNWVISNLTHLLERAESVGLKDEIPTDFLTRLERAYNYHLYAMMPDGRIPGLNDSGNADVKNHLAKAHELFPEREDFLFGSTLGLRGKKPQELSYAFPYTGHYVMRSDWDADAVYALLDSGPFGYGHQHEDKLTFVLYAYGRQLILDPGNFSYDRSPERKYVLGTHGHNTIMVDGEGQRRRINRDTYVRPKPWDTPTPRGDDTVWYSDDELDAVRGSYHDGYGPKAETKVHHTRTMVFIKPDYFVILDTLEPEDAVEHTYSSLFHIDDTEATLNPATLTVQTQTPDKANVALIPARFDGLECRIAKGEKDPMQGWANGPWREVPTAIYTWKSASTAHQAMIVYPLKPGQTCPVQTVQLHPTAETMDVNVSFEDGTAERIQFTLNSKDRPVRLFREK